METAYVLKVPEKNFRDLYLLFCGYSECEPLHSFGPAVRPNYLIHFILAGKGKYYVNGKEYTIQQGQGFLIEPNRLTKYEADQADPWTYIWIGFDGNQSAQHLNNIGLGHDQLIFQSEKIDELKEVVLEMLQYHTFQPKEEYLLQSLLYKFFYFLADGAAPLPKKMARKENEYIRKSIEFIQAHYNYPIKVADIANFVSLHRSYLSNIFKRETGIPIQDYLANFRLSRAAELLSMTDLSMEQISESCGYRDPLVFSKAFKKVKGMTPSQYRKLNNKTIINNFAE